MVVNAIGWIVLGVITGLASGILAQNGGRFWRDVPLGVLGAVSGGWILTAIVVTDVAGLNIWSQVAAIVGGIAVLVVRHCFVGVVGIAGLLLMVWDGIGGSASRTRNNHDNKDRI